MKVLFANLDTSGDPETIHRFPRHESPHYGTYGSRNLYAEQNLPGTYIDSVEAADEVYLALYLRDQSTSLGLGKGLLADHSVKIARGMSVCLLKIITNNSHS
jgi:hypothetical protein